MTIPAFLRLSPDRHATYAAALSAFVANEQRLVDAGGDGSDAARSRIVWGKAWAQWHRERAEGKVRL